MELLSYMNLVNIVIDEIAIEGWDVIMLEALPDRLALKLREKDTISGKLEEQVWDIHLQVQDLSFYGLETPRPKCITFNRYDYVDPDFEIIPKLEVTSGDIYLHSAIDAVKNGPKGSCQTYHTRKDIGAFFKSLNFHET